jgi:hypothetical protein
MDYDNQHNELLTGIIASTIANFSTCRGEEGFKPSDFMPSYVEPEEIPPSDEECISDISQLFSPFIN